MIQMLEPMLSEIREETFTTKRVLERVPADKLSWRPHPKSMSLGQLALQVATIPGSLAKLAQLEEFDASQASFEPPVPVDLNEIHTAFDQSVRSAEKCLSGMSETAALGFCVHTLIPARARRPWRNRNLLSRCRARN